jgi:hypothetical protein
MEADFPFAATDHTAVPVPEVSELTDEIVTPTAVAVAVMAVNPSPGFSIITVTSIVFPAKT